MTILGKPEHMDTLARLTILGTLFQIFSWQDMSKANGLNIFKPNQSSDEPHFLTVMPLCNSHTLSVG